MAEGEMAAPVPNRGLLRLAFVYIVAVLLGTVGIAIVALVVLLRGATPDTKGAPFAALVGLLLAPVWFYMLGGIRRRLHGEVNAQIIPRSILARGLRYATGIPALLNGIVGAANIARFSNQSTPAAWGATVGLIAVGIVLVFRATRPSQW